MLKSNDECFSFVKEKKNTCYSTGVGSSIGCFINFHNIFQLASYFPSSFVVSTSLLIYVVLYKNELLSNLYVLLIKVLCFATSSSSYPFSSSSSKPQNTRAILPRLSHGPLPSRFFWFGWLSPASVCLCCRCVCVRMCSFVCLLCNFNDSFHVCV